MTLSFDNLAPSLAAATHQLMSSPPKTKIKGCHWMDQDIVVTFTMKRKLIKDKKTEGPEPARSSYKSVTDTASVTIDPPNKELAEKVQTFFLNQKIPANMGAPERLQFDMVFINGDMIIG